MIRITSFAEKSDQALRFFVLNRILRRFTPALRDGGILFCFSSTALTRRTLEFGHFLAPKA